MITSFSIQSAHKYLSVWMTYVQKVFLIRFLVNRLWYEHHFKKNPAYIALISWKME